MKLNAKRITKLAPQIKVYSFDTVDSTNKIAKKLAAKGCGEGVLVCAAKQTEGKGRLGRTFVSERGGVYFSLVLKPDLSPTDTLFITVAAAVAAARAIESVSSKKCDIKWVNDVYVDNKKVCGILTESVFDSSGSLNYAVLGVGINVFAPKGGFPENLPLAGSVYGKKVFKNRLKEHIVAEFVSEFFGFYNNLEQKVFMNEYKQRSFLTDKEITFLKNNKIYSGTVVRIDDKARLVIKSNDKEETLSCGEIQIVGMEQSSV